MLYLQTKSNVLNKWFVGILWLKIIFSSLQLVSSIIDQINGDPNWTFYVGTLLALFAIGGAYLLANASKIGFYLVVSANLCIAIISGAFGYNIGMWSSLAQIVLLLLLMLLSYNGKNVYQVLWGKES